MTIWNADQYDHFTAARKRPGLDLLAQIPQRDYKRVVDLGCGTGFLTTQLRERFPASELIALDSSTPMLAKAHELAPTIDWREGDINSFNIDTIDLLYSNAVLHWLDDHQTIFPKLLTHLAPQGVFAFQLPNNFQQPSHQCMLETIKSGPWQQKLLPLWRPEPTHQASWYYNLLAPLSSELNLWETTYYQQLSGNNPIVEWTKGTWLRRFLNKLDDTEQQQFLDSYNRLIAHAYPAEDNGTTLFPFRRLFMVGIRN